MSVIKSTYLAILTLSSLYTMAHAAPTSTCQCASPSPSTTSPPPIFPSAGEIITADIKVLDKEAGFIIPMQIDGVNDTFNLLFDTILPHTFASARNCDSCGSLPRLPFDSPVDGLNDVTFFTSAGDDELVSLSAPTTFNITLGGVESETFIAAARSIDELTANATFDGLLGLNMHLDPEKQKFHFVQQLANSGRISKPVVTFKLPSISDTNATGRVLFGDPSTFIGNSTSFIQENASSTNFWEFIGEPTVNGKPISLNTNATRIRLNTNVNGIFMPRPDLEALMAAFGTEAKKTEGGFTLPCNSTTQFSITFGSQEFALKPDLYISTITAVETPGHCFSRFGTQDFGDDAPDHWNVGSPFASSFIFSLDYSNGSMTIASTK